jgi:TIR domain/Sel1 repeat
MADVFISYSKHDWTIAETLAKALELEGYDVWWDFDLYAGDDFHKVIREKISLSKAVIVIWSESAVDSQWVRGEAQEALDDAKLISTHVSNFNPRKVPINFRCIHTENVENLGRIIKALNHKNIGNGRGVPQDDKEAVRYYRLAAEQGHAYGQPNLGLMYQNGRGIL